MPPTTCYIHFQGVSLSRSQLERPFAFTFFTGRHDLRAITFFRLRVYVVYVCVSCYPHLRLTHTLSGRSQLPLPCRCHCTPPTFASGQKKSQKRNSLALLHCLSVCLSVPLSICLFDNILEHMCVLTVGECVCMCVCVCVSVCVCYLCVMFVLCLLRAFLIFHSPLWHGEFVPPVQLTANRWRLAIKMLLTHSLPQRCLLSPTVLGQRRDWRISKNDIEILQKFKNH